MQNRVNQVINTDLHSETNISSGFMSKLKSNCVAIYFIGIPLAVMIILLFWKPDFVTEDVVNDDKITEKKMSFKRLLLAGVVSFAIILILYVAYNYKKK